MAVSTSPVPAAVIMNSLDTGKEKKAVSQAVGVRTALYPNEAVKLYYIYGLYIADLAFTDSIALHKGTRYLAFNHNEENERYNDYKTSISYASQASYKEGEKLMKKLFSNYGFLQEAQHSYNIWYKHLQTLGMAEMRKRGWDPLHW